MNNGKSAQPIIWFQIYLKFLVYETQTVLNTSAIETPGGNRILVKNIIAQQITRKRGIFKKTFGI
jgi:hypothetical protein